MGYRVLGQMVRSIATVIDINGSTADPSTLVFLTSDPHGTVATYAYGSASITRVATGAYYIDLVPSVPGDWSRRWKATGGVIAAGEDTFTVRQSLFTL